MPKRRPSARRSYAQRRVRRYTGKFGKYPFALRFKKQLSRMTELWEEEAKVHVDCEEPTLAELEAKGVPSDQHDYYLGFMKRMLDLYRRFTGATLESEKTSLISEYVLRGYNQEVLEQVQEVVAECAEIPPVPPFTCEDVYACLEGDYSTWTEKWEYDFPDGLNATTSVGITFTPNYLCISYYDGSSKLRFVVIGITDASAKFTSPSGAHYTSTYPRLGYASYFHSNTLVDATGGGLCFSILGKYVVVVLNGYAKFEVWKDGVKAWTSPLASEAVSGATKYYSIGLRYDGKYVVAVTNNKKLVCFEGS